MTEVEQIEILLSKKKMLLTFFGSVVFVGLGILIIVIPSFTDTSFFDPITFASTIVCVIVGLAGILDLFGNINLGRLVQIGIV